MKKPWHKADHTSGNTQPEPSENYIPLTAHQFSKPGVQKRAVNNKPVRDSKVTPAKDGLHANPKGLFRGPGARMKRSRKF